MRYCRRMTGTRWLGLAFLAAAVCSMGCGRSEDRLRRDYRERSGYAEEETAFRPDLSGQGLMPLRNCMGSGIWRAINCIGTKP